MSRTLPGRGWLRRLRSDSSGIAMTEFAMASPVFLLASLWGLESVNYAITSMRVHQTAAHLADGVARLGDTSTLQDRKIYEEDIVDVLVGGHHQAGEAIDLYGNGRVVISSLEVYDQTIHCAKNGCPSTSATDGTHFISWQRCTGKKAHTATYGQQNDAMPSGMGPSDAKVFAEDDGATIFVEVSYDYQPLIANSFVSNAQITTVASHIVRTHRDRTEIYRYSGSGIPDESKCDAYQAPPQTCKYIDDEGECDDGE